MPRPAFPVFLILTCACFTFVLRWKRTEVTVARAVMGALFTLPLETSSHTRDIFYPLHKSVQVYQHLPGISSYASVCPIDAKTLRATFVITGLGSTRRIRNPDVAVCLATHVQLHVLPCLSIPTTATVCWQSWLTFSLVFAWGVRFHLPLVTLQSRVDSAPYAMLSN